MGEGQTIFCKTCTYFLENHNLCFFSVAKNVFQRFVFLANPSTPQVTNTMTRIPTTSALAAVLVLFLISLAQGQVLRNPNGTEFCVNYCSYAPNGEPFIPIRGTCFFTNNTQTKDLLSCFCLPPYGGPNV